MNEFGEWLTGEAYNRGWSLNELARRAGRGSSTISMIATGQNRPGWDVCVSLAHALGELPETVLRRAGLLPALPPAVEEEQEFVTILRDQPGSVRRLLLSMLRGLTRRSAPATTDAELAELIAIYERLDPEWRAELCRASRMFEQNARGNPPRIIGEEEETLVERPSPPDGP